MIRLYRTSTVSQELKLLRNDVFFSRFTGNESEHGTNKSREPLHAPIHFSMNPEKKTHSLYLRFFPTKTLSKILRETLYEFKIPTVTGTQRYFMY